MRIGTRKMSDLRLATLVALNEALLRELKAAYGAKYPRLQHSSPTLVAIDKFLKQIAEDK